jgi:hypothetical protein
MEDLTKFGMDACGGHGGCGWHRSRRRLLQRMGNVELEAVSQKILSEIRNEANCILSFGVEAALLQGASRWFARGRKAAERGCFYKSS